MEQRYLSPRQIADLVPFTADWIRQECRRGELSSIRVNGRYLITVEDLEEFLERNRTTEPRRRRRRRNVPPEFEGLTARQRRELRHLHY